MANVSARILCVAAVLAATLAACVPTASRKNARLTQGVDVDFTAGMQYVPPGEDSNGTATATDQILHLEIDFQYAHKWKDGSGFAAQLKLPLNIIFSSLDFYYQLPEANSKWFFGFGAEIGALPGVYAVATHYIDDDFYVSFTPRVLNAEERDQRAVLLNPQLSLGLAGEADLSMFVNFAHHTGEGFDFDIDFLSDDESDDYRKNFWLLGISARI